MAASRKFTDELLLSLAEQDEQDFAVAPWHQIMGLAALSVCEESQAGGSLPEKAANKYRDFVAGHRRMMLDTSGRLTPSAMTILEGLACCHTRPSLPLAAQNMDYH
jgi:hypothetical protein